ncbi:NAD-dependent epimerase/dehydratase family protein [Thermococcus sp.]|uniref:NAD-dependent epimerase/dehydratase family protein n=1 Tax=Thermococcus sp. TaxID=35749 RepID=UPI00261F906B|nr:NAD-dependent epimerase/dehydratase family protein [Thermococcus sp.]
MRVLLLGGTGFIGGFLLRELKDRGHDVVVPTRRDLKLGNAKTIKVSGRPEEYARLVERLDPDAVVNLIGVLRGDYSVHYEIPKALSRVVEGSEVRLVHVSALGTDGGSPVEYFRSKALGEKEVQKLENYAIVRPSLVLGPGQRLFRDAFRRKLFPDLKTRVQPVDVRDLSKILADLTEKGGVDELNVCGSEVVPLGRLVWEVMRATGKGVYLIPLPEFLLRLVERLDSSIPMALTENVCPGKESVVFGRPLRESIAFTAEGLR